MSKNELDRLRKIEHAARLLFAELDYTVPGWRDETLNQPDGVGDAVNSAWDQLADALGITAE